MCFALNTSANTSQVEYKVNMVRQIKMYHEMKQYLEKMNI